MSAIGKLFKLVLWILLAVFICSFNKRIDRRDQAIHPRGSDPGAAYTQDYPRADNTVP